MKTNGASGVLTALVYVQVMLCFAGAATVLLRDRAEPQNVASETAAPVHTTTAVRL